MVHCTPVWQSDTSVVIVKHVIILLPTHFASFVSSFFVWASLNTTLDMKHLIRYISRLRCVYTSIDYDRLMMYYLFILFLTAVGCFIRYSICVID